MNRDYKVMAGLETVVRLERSVFEYRKLVQGLVARILVSWTENADFFSTALMRIQGDGPEPKQDVETIERLYCFPLRVAHPQSYDFERFAYNCPQYYLRQAIVAALHIVQTRAKEFVKPHYETRGMGLMVTDVLWSDIPMIPSLFFSTSGISLNLNHFEPRPQTNFWSDRDEVFERRDADNLFLVKLYDRASRTWMWCEWRATHNELESLQWRMEGIEDPIRLPDDMIRWHEANGHSSLKMDTAKHPDLSEAKEFAVFKGIELPPSYISYALGEAKVLSASGQGYLHRKIPSLSRYD